MKIRKNVAVSDSGFLFNPLTGDSFSVNPIGQTIISSFKENKPESEILENILEEYRVDKNTAEKDLNDFKRMLENYKLID
ncbi:MAG: PqqD family protein [Fluviicola sp.]|nr:PqqD family protein [Fluviicola sp.]